MPYALCPVVPHLSEKGYIFTAAEEMLQGILPNRSASIEDFLFSFCGIAVFYWIGEVWDRKKGN
jgi:hypothetical protein